MATNSGTRAAAETTVHPQLSHCGIYARDVKAQAAFYRRVLGLVVADAGVNPNGHEFVFLTAAPDHHHQVVFISGRTDRGATTVNQLSFKVGGLEQLKAMFDRVRNAGIEEIRQVCHGNALSFYFVDPEGNGIEIYMDTPWYVPQAHGVPVDLTMPDDEIMAAVEKHCRETPGFMPLSAWRAEVQSRLAADS
jgi:catechol 2,3-dioxygenase